MTDTSSKEITYDAVQEIAREVYPRIIESNVQKEAREYLADFRNIDVKTLEDIFMFYVLDEPYLHEIVPDEFERVFVGLEMKNDSIFRERFIFPIQGINGDLTGWIGYDYESPTKYLFARTALGKKENIFFNMNNIEECYKANTAILVEGLFHSARLNEVGFKNNLALLGKRKSRYHNRVLNRFDLKILIPDNDEAGRSALPFWEKELTGKVAIIKLKDEKDENGKVLSDIDDKLKVDKSRYDKFRELYSKIVKDSESHSFVKEKYSF